VLQRFEPAKLPGPVLEPTDKSLIESDCLFLVFKSLRVAFAFSGFGKICCFKIFFFFDGLRIDAYSLFVCVSYLSVSFIVGDPSSKDEDSLIFS